MDSEISCLEEYKRFVNDCGYNNMKHYKESVLPTLLVDHPYILKKIEKQKLAKLPKSFCNTLIEKYFKSLDLAPRLNSNK